MTAAAVAFAALVAPAQLSAQNAPANAAAVEPGYLGVLADTTQDGSTGIVVLNVMPEGPAAVAGLRVGDVITSIDGHTAAAVEDMANRLAGRPAGDQVTFVIRRGNDVSRVEVRLGRRPPVDQRPFENFGRVNNSNAAGPATVPQYAPTPNALPSQAGAGVESLPEPQRLPNGAAVGPLRPTPSGPGLLARPQPAGDSMLLGIRAVPVSPEIQKSLSLPHPRGSLVVEVHPDSPAAEAGIPLDAVITEVDGIRVDTPTALAEIVQAKGRGADVRLSYYRFGMPQQKMIRLGGGAPLEVPQMPKIPELPPVASPQSPAATNAAQQMAAEAEAIRGQIRALETRLSELEAQLNATAPAPQK